MPAVADAETLLGPRASADAGPAGDIEMDGDDFEHIITSGGSRPSGPAPGRSERSRPYRAMDLEDVTPDAARDPFGLRSLLKYRRAGLVSIALTVAGAACLALLTCGVAAQGRPGAGPAGMSVTGPEQGQVGLEIVPPAGTGVSLFCFAVMRPGTTETELITFQIERRAGIFACEAYAVISSVDMTLSPGNGNVKTWYNPAQEVPIGSFGQQGVTTNSFLNTQIFIQAFDTLVKAQSPPPTSEGLIFAHDFLIKVDPDAVFFPDRARAHLLPHKGKLLYFTNCDKFNYAQPPIGPKLFGAVEIYSISAMAKYRDGAAQCANRDWHGWGEDYYMQTCMDLLGVPSQGDFLMVGDGRCTYAPCTDSSRMAYHDFKDQPSWEACFKQAIGEIA